MTGTDGANSASTEEPQAREQQAPEGKGMTGIDSAEGAGAEGAGTDVLSPPSNTSSTGAQAPRALA